VAIDPEPALQAAAAAYLSGEIRLLQPPVNPPAEPGAAAPDYNGKPRPPLLPDDTLEHVLSAPYNTLVALAAANRTTVALPRLLLWYGADFGQSLPQRLVQMKGMLEAGSEDASAWAAGGNGGGGVCKIGERRYAHAVLTGLLHSYATASSSVGDFLAAQEAELVALEQLIKPQPTIANEKASSDDWWALDDARRVIEYQRKELAQRRAEATPAAALAKAVAAVDARVRYTAYNWDSNAM